MGMKEAISESRLMTTAEKLRRVCLERFGSGDECTICEAEIEGFGFCVGCGERITDPMRCVSCGANVLRKGVCQGCAEDHVTVQSCGCSWMGRLPDIVFSNGWHVKRSNGADTATELCPTYWEKQGRKVDPKNRRRLLPMAGNGEEDRY